MGRTRETTLRRVRRKRESRGRGEQRAFLRIGYSKPYSPLFLSLSIGLISIIVFEEHWC